MLFQFAVEFIFTGVPENVGFPPQAHHFTFSIDLRSIRDNHSTNTINIFLRWAHMAHHLMLKNIHWQFEDGANKKINYTKARNLIIWHLRHLRIWHRTLIHVKHRQQEMTKCQSLTRMGTSFPNYNHLFWLFKIWSRDTEWNPVADAEVKTLFSVTDDEYAVISIDRSVVGHQRCAWVFSADSHDRIVKETSSAFAATTSSGELEVLTSNIGISLLRPQPSTHAGILWFIEHD